MPRFCFFSALSKLFVALVPQIDSSSWTFAEHHPVWGPRSKMDFLTCNFVKRWCFCEAVSFITFLRLFHLNMPLLGRLWAVAKATWFFSLHVWNAYFMANQGKSVVLLFGEPQLRFFWLSLDPVFCWVVSVRHFAHILALRLNRKFRETTPQHSHGSPENHCRYCAASLKKYVTLWKLDFKPPNSVEAESIRKRVGIENGCRVEFRTPTPCGGAEPPSPPRSPQ